MRTTAALLVAMTATASAAPALQSQSDPYPGIHREVWVDSDVPARIYLVRIDLTSAEIAVYATKESDKGIKTSELSDRINAQVAINGGQFFVQGFTPRGLAMGDGTIWTNTADNDQMAVLHFRRAGERTLASIAPPTVPVTLPDGTEGVVSGRPLLVNNGVIEPQPDCNDTIIFPCTRAPRTAVGLSADGNTMWLVVVNGWQAASHGLTIAELAQFIRARGAYMAVALDGGASSTLVVNGALASTPSDGVERTVANHIGIKYGALPKGEMVGFLCRTADIPACGLDQNLRVLTARVTLDDGRFVDTTNGYFGFSGITPRLACITVKKTNYLTKVQCKPVKSGLQTYNSVIMEPGVDMVDAGVPDAPMFNPDDADIDTPPRPEGFPDDPPRGGCCGVTRDRDVGVHLFVTALVAWRLRRRRGTKA